MSLVYQPSAVYIATQTADACVVDGGSNAIVACGVGGGQVAVNGVAGQAVVRAGLARGDAAFIPAGAQRPVLH